MAYRDDSKELADKIRERIEDVIHEFWPDAIVVNEKQGRVALLTPKIKKGKGTKKGPNKPTSSFRVNLDSDRGKWYRFSQGLGGWGLQLLFYAKTDRLAESKSDWAECYQYAREFLGIVPQREDDEEEQQRREERRAAEQAERDRRSAEQAAAAAAKQARRAATAQEIWSQCKPLAGSHGDAYLQARGVPPVAEWSWDPWPALRFHPALDYERDWRMPHMPAVVALVQNAFGELVSIWQIYLDPKAPAKAPIDEPKIGRGSPKGGAVRIGGDAEHIGVAEGFETSLGAWLLERCRYPVWSCLSTSGLINFEPPMFVKRISGFPDGDAGKLVKATGKLLEPPGLSAMKTLRDRIAPTGIKFDINEMCLAGDALDLWQTMRRYEERHSPV